MDGVLFQPSCFWKEVHKIFGTEKEGQEFAKYLHEDYATLVQEVMKLWKGKDTAPYFALVNSIKYMKGVKEVFHFCKKNDLQTAIVSASSLDLARRVQHDFGIDHIYANELVIKNHKVTGEFIWPIGAGKEKKAAIIKHLCQDLGISTHEVVFIGDDDIDVEACREAGMSIAFNSTSEKLKKVATHIVEGEDLGKVLSILRNLII